MKCSNNFTFCCCVDNTTVALFTRSVRKKNKKRCNTLKRFNVESMWEFHIDILHVPNPHSHSARTKKTKALVLIILPRVSDSMWERHVHFIFNIQGHEAGKNNVCTAVPPNVELVWECHIHFISNLQRHIARIKEEEGMRPAGAAAGKHAIAGAEQRFPHYPGYENS